MINPYERNSNISDIVDIDIGEIWVVNPRNGLEHVCWRVTSINRETGEFMVEPINKDMG